MPEHAIVTVELWDVPGQNDVDLRKTYYLDVDAVIGEYRFCYMHVSRVLS